MSDVVSVCDNGPVHVSLKSVLVEEELNGVLLLRLVPYSAPLTHIEECWSDRCQISNKEAAEYYTPRSTQHITCRNNTN